MTVNILGWIYCNKIKLNGNFLLSLPRQNSSTNFYFAEFIFDLFIILFNTSWNYCSVYNYKN